MTTASRTHSTTGDLGEYRGQPMGFWEYLHDEPTGGVTLQRIIPKGWPVGRFVAKTLGNVVHPRWRRSIDGRGGEPYCVFGL